MAETVPRRKFLLPAKVYHGAWFPGRALGGLALLFGPIVYLVGLLLRYIAVRVSGFSDAQWKWFDEQPFRAPQELAAYAVNPNLVIAAYAVFALGAMLMCFAVLTLARMIISRCPVLAITGAAFAILAFFGRLYYAGVDQTGFLLVRQLGLEQATKIMMSMYVDVSYGLLRIPVTASVGSIIGMILLAIGAYRSGLFGLVRALVLPWFGWIWMGVLKASDLSGVLSGAALCVVLFPLGVRLLRDRNPEFRTLAETESSQERRAWLSW